MVGNPSGKSLALIVIRASIVQRGISTRIAFTLLGIQVGPVHTLEVFILRGRIRSDTPTRPPRRPRCPERIRAHWPRSLSLMRIRTGDLRLLATRGGRLLLA
jgi:hypothetical protein